MLHKSEAYRGATIVSLVLSGISTVAVIVIFWVLPYFSPVDAGAELTLLKIPRGMSSQAIADRLAREKLIRSALIFQLSAHLSGSSRKLKAGTYQLSRAMSLMQILDQLKAGRVVTQQFVVPEGLTIAQIGELWEHNGFGTAAAFNEVVREAAWRMKYGIEAQTLEGYLFPNTYQFAEETSARKVVKMMLDEFDRRWTPLLAQEAEARGLSLHEVVTLASIIEEEARADSERPLISAVFHNRLRRGWRLEADPTVLYALENPKRLLTSADLTVDSPYNTYLHRGLPPGPICNPGMASILAALRPASAAYLYFVAIGDGTHHFSTTLNEHRHMVQKVKRNSN